MAFGHGPSSKTHDFRAIPVVMGEGTAVKQAGLALLFTRCQAALTHFGALAFEPEPLNGTQSQKLLTAKLLKAQKAYTGLNKAYLERCRTTVLAAVGEQNKRYFRQLVGRLHHCLDEIPEASRKANAQGEVRQHYYLPAALLDGAGEVPPAVVEDLQVLQLMALDFADAVSLFQGALDAQSQPGEPTPLTPAQCAVLLEIHRQVQTSHRAPDFGGADACVALPLDYRVLPAAWRDLPGRLDESVSRLLQDTDNTRFSFFLDIAHPTPGQARLRLPLTFNAHLLAGASSRGRRGYAARGLTLLLSANGSAEMRLTVAQPKVVPVALAVYMLLTPKPSKA